MLIYVASLEFQLSTCIVIHNYCLNTKLVSPVYFSNGVVCSKPFDQQMDIGAEVRTSFKIETIENKFESALLFKLKRYVESDYQYNMDTSATATDEATHVHILIVWEMKNAESFAYIALVEHTKAFTWDEDKLKKLYYENHNRLKEYTDTTPNIWLVGDNVILKVKFKVKSSKRNLKLSISIYEEKKSDYAMKPFCINLER
jgi:hypothetical protein